MLSRDDLFLVYLWAKYNNRKKVSWFSIRAMEEVYRHIKPRKKLTPRFEAWIEAAYDQDRKPRER